MRNNKIARDDVENQNAPEREPYLLKVIENKIFLSRNQPKTSSGVVRLYSDEQHYSLVKVRDISSLRCEQ